MGPKIQGPACMALSILTSFTHLYQPTQDLVPFGSTIVEIKSTQSASPWVEFEWRLTVMDTLVRLESHLPQAARLAPTTA